MNRGEKNRFSKILSQRIVGRPERFLSKDDRDFLKEQREYIGDPNLTYIDAILFNIEYQKSNIERYKGKVEALDEAIKNLDENKVLTESEESRLLEYRIMSDEPNATYKDVLIHDRAITELDYNVSKEADRIYRRKLYREMDYAMARDFGYTDVSEDLLHADLYNDLEPIYDLYRYTKRDELKMLHDMEKARDYRGEFTEEDIKNQEEIYKIAEYNAELMSDYSLARMEQQRDMIEKLSRKKQASLITRWESLKNKENNNEMELE